MCPVGVLYLQRVQYHVRVGEEGAMKPGSYRIAVFVNIRNLVERFTQIPPLFLARQIDTLDAQIARM